MRIPAAPGETPGPREFLLGRQERLGWSERSGGTDDVEVADLLVEGLDVDLEHSRRLCLVPTRRLEHAVDVLPLHLLERDERRLGGLGRRRRLDHGQLGGQHARLALVAIVEDLQALDEVAKLSDVARPLVTLESLHGLGREAEWLPAPGPLGREVLDEERDVVLATA